MKFKTFFVFTLVILLTFQMSFADNNYELNSQDDTQNFSGELVDKGDIPSVIHSIREAGVDRYKTAVSVSMYFYLPNLIVTSGENYPDALSASSLAYAIRKATANSDIKYSILLAKQNSIPWNERLQYNHRDHAVVLGGKGVLGDAVEDELKVWFPDVERIGGKDRFETSLNIAKEITDYYTPEMKKLIIVNGYSYADALSAANVVSYTDGAPVLLVRKDSIPKDIKEYIVDLEPEEIYIVGGKGVVSLHVEDILRFYCSNVSRISGADRYLTNQATIDLLGGIDNRDLVIATGKDFPDGLSAGVFANNLRGVLMLTGDNLKDFQRQCLIEEIDYGADYFVVGGTAAVSEKIENEALNYLNTLKKYELADGSTGVITLTTFEAEREEFLSLINQYREENNVGPLRYEYSWISPTNLRTAEIVNQFTHTRPDGSIFRTAYDIVSMPIPDSENILLTGSKDITSVIEAWKQSPEDNEHMLREDYDKVMFCGGKTRNIITGKYMYYWVAVFI
ncbi:MAG: hypothetical protein CSB16_00715 [Clostridiales bacterium]|nr:MAG: hypothetical protein CSB16_00715 [Clostridiales bacterium]